MKDLEKFLKVLSEGMKTLAKGVETIADKVDALAKAQTVSKQPTKPAAKSAAETTPKPPRSNRKPSTGKPTTATESVYQLINRSKMGVDTTTIKKKTGFDDKKIHNIIYKLKKQGKIKSEKKGVYVKA